MNEDELRERILMREHLEQQESVPAAAYDPCAGMNENDLRNYCRFLFEQVQLKDKQSQEILSQLSEIKDELHRTRIEDAAERKRLFDQVVDLNERLGSSHSENAQLKKDMSDMVNRLSVLNGEHYGSSKSQKGIAKRKPVTGKNDGRGDFDGTSPSVQSDAGVSDASAPACDSADAVSETSASKGVYHGPSRLGCHYQKTVVGDPIVHKCDRSVFPAGTEILSVDLYKVRDVISQIVEHHFERVKVKYPDGKIATVFIPFADDTQAALYTEIVPGTHVTANLLSYLLFNRYQMATPAYRETNNRLADMDWKTCRQNLANWADKGAIQLNKLIPALKQIALQEGADVNVDETWERYQTHYGHRKTYMWCLVNRKARIVMFFYEDCEYEDGSKHEGGRGRRVLTDFLGDAKIRSLQSDGYNVYMYLDEELVDIEHLCCLAHARSKFKTAYDQGCEKARFFLEKMGALYRLEEDYRRLELSAQEIKKRRNDASTNNIVDDLRNELFDLLALPKDEKSDLMQRALNYLHSFWKQLFAYRNNGEYTIDNLAAERAIRPLTVQRKNSLFFGSTKGAVNSAVYNTFIETCKQVGISFRDYFRAVMKELGSGREDYENLLPMTIGIKQNN